MHDPLSRVCLCGFAAGEGGPSWFVALLLLIVDCVDCGLWWWWWLAKTENVEWVRGEVEAVLA